MTDANSLLEQEPELEALAGVISVKNRYINASTALIVYLMKGITKEQINSDPELRNLVDEFIAAAAPVGKPFKET